MKVQNFISKNYRNLLLRAANFFSVTITIVGLSHGICHILNCVLQLGRFPCQGALFPNSHAFLNFFCSENRTIEFAFIQEWYKQTPTNVKITIKFFGMSVEPETLMASNLVNKISITNYLSKTMTEPVMEFKSFCQPLSPAEASIESMKERDVIDGNQSFRLLLTYKFNVPKSEIYRFVHDDIRHYKKYIDCYSLQIFTTSKKHILTTGSVEKAKLLQKGDYIIQVQIRHSDPKILEKLKDARLLATQSIIPEITCDLYADPESALKESGPKAKKRNFKCGEKASLFMSAVSPLKYPYTYPTGSHLKGELSLHPNETYKSKYHSSFEITYLLAPPKSYLNDKKGKLEIEADKEIDGEKEDLKNAIRDIEISYITKETNAEKALALFEKLSTEFPTHLPIYSAEIQRLSKLKDFLGLKKVVEKLLEIAESNKVAEYFGVKSEFSEENLRKKEIMEKKKTAIINALFLQANLGLDEFLKSTKKDIPDAFRNGFDPKEKPKEDVVKKDEKAADSKKTKDEAKAEVVEKEAAENVSATEKVESFLKGDVVALLNPVGRRNEDMVKTDEKHVDNKAEASPPKADKSFVLFISSSSSSESIVAVDPLESTMNTESTKGNTENNSITPEEKTNANLGNAYAFTLEEVEKLYRHYMLFVDSTSENAKIIQAKYAVAHGRYGTALSELQKIIIDQKTTSDYLSTEKAIIQLLTKLGWDHLTEEAQKALLIKHQKFYRLF